MPNFFETQRTDVLKFSQRAMAMKLGVANTTVATWEADEAVPGLPVAKLAAEYQVSESRMERELMAMRRRIEARKEKSALSSR